MMMMIMTISCERYA